MHFSWVVLTNLLRRPSRTGFTVFALALSIAATTALIAIGRGYAHSKQGYYEQRGIDIVVVRAGVAERVTSSLRGTLADRLRTLAQVRQVDAGLTEMVALGDGGLIGVPLRGVDPSGFTLGQFRVTAGRTLRAGDRGVALLGTSLAASLGKSPGDRMEIEGTEFEVVGIYTTDDPLEANTAAAPLQDVQELMGRPEQVSEIYVDVDDSVRTREQWETLCRDLESLRDEQGNPLGFRAMTTRDFAASDTETKLLQAMAWGTSLVAGGLAAIGTLNTMLMSVLERGTELGLLRALGWSRRRVLGMVFQETLLLWLAATVAGTTLAWLTLRLLALLPATRTLVAGGLPPGALLAGSGIGLVASLFGAAYPAWRAARVQPKEAMRDE